MREMRPSSWIEKSPHPQSRLVIGKSGSLWGQSPGSWGVVYRQSTGWGGYMGLTKLSTVTQNQGTAVPVRERTDPEVGFRNPPNPQSRVGIGKSGSLWGQNPGSWGVIYRQSTGWGGLMGLTKLSTGYRSVPVWERRDPGVGLRKPHIPNPDSGSESCCPES